MKINLKKYFWLALVIGVLTMLFFIKNFSDLLGLNKADDHQLRPHSPDISKGEIRNPILTVADAYVTPIEFYGKVVDQNNNPIVDAEIAVIINNRHFLPSTNRFTMHSDSNGDFAIKDQQGASVSINVSKAGYMVISRGQTNVTHSGGLFDYAIKDDKGNCYKNVANPTRFMLFKIGEKQDLHHIKEMLYDIPLDGSPYEICLDADQKNGKHRIIVSFKGEYQFLNVKPDNPFSWQFSSKIIGGGFVKRKNAYDFIAPEIGYMETLFYDYPSKLNRDDWKLTIKCDYFIKFSDSVYGRVIMSVSGNSTSSPLSFESWIFEKPQLRDTTTDDPIFSSFGED